MAKSLVIIFFAMFIACSFAMEMEQVEVARKLISNFIDKDTKTLFKVYHYVFNKEYDYDTEEGINRYKIFKENVKKIKAHNASKSSYKKGINHLTDMTADEVREYYNLKPLPVSEVTKNLRRLGGLDDFNDEEEQQKPEPPKKKDDGKKRVSRIRSNFEKKMMRIRDQRRCGSGWAFATVATVEGYYNNANPDSQLSELLSVQQLLDCNTDNNGCNGGWYTTSFSYLTRIRSMYEKDYKYKATRIRSCSANNNKASRIRLSRIRSSININYSDDTNFDEMLAAGPVAVAVDANDDWFSYESGVYDGTCSGNVNHGAVVVGYRPPQFDGDFGVFRIRNSWSKSWGTSGHIDIAENADNSQSCNIEKYAYQPAGFA